MCLVALNGGSGAVDGVQRNIAIPCVGRVSA